MGDGRKDGMGMDEWHKRYAPWCARRDRHEHTVQLNGPHLVDGRPAGPMLLLRDRQVLTPTLSHLAGLPIAPGRDCGT